MDLTSFVFFYLAVLDNYVDLVFGLMRNRVWISIDINGGSFMASVSSIKTDITTLSEYQLQELLNYIGEMLTFGSLKGSLNDDFK